jgi:hypothetical protein
MRKRKRNSCSFEIERFFTRNGAKLKEGRNLPLKGTGKGFCS